MAVLGSVFLGDAHHHRVFSTPPTSPPPSTSSSGFGSRAQQAATVHLQPEMQAPSVPDTQALRLPEISPAVSLELRLRWLEALLLGVRQDASKERRAGKSTATQEEERKRDTLYRRAEDVQRRLDTVLATNDGLKRFMEHYDKHAQFLVPSFALSGLSGSSSSLPSYTSMSSTELDAFLSDMEDDIRAADRDLREIDALEQRGMTGAGKLGDHEPLQPRLRALVKAHEEDLAKAASLETRIGALLEKHASKVDALSELFVAWNDVITEAEDHVGKAEREKEEQRRLGYDYLSGRHIRIIAIEEDEQVESNLVL